MAGTEPLTDTAWPAGLPVAPGPCIHRVPCLPLLGSSSLCPWAAFRAAGSPRAAAPKPPWLGQGFSPHRLEPAVGPGWAQLSHGHPRTTAQSRRSAEPRPAAPSTPGHRTTRCADVTGQGGVSSLPEDTPRRRGSPCPPTCPHLSPAASGSPRSPAPAPWEEQRSLLQCVTLVEPSKSVLVLPGQVMQWFWPNSGW